MHISTDKSQGHEKDAKFLSKIDRANCTQFCEKHRDKENIRDCPESLFALNEKLDGMSPSRDVTENIIRRTLAETERFRKDDQSVYWLTITRLAELAMINAGAYADGCEFRAAGDLLANPLKILIHIKGRRFPVLKKRHAKLSEQLNSNGEAGEDFVDWFKTNASLEVREKPLIPDLCDRMENSGVISLPHINEYKRKMNRVADVIGFLSAWNIESAEELFARMRTASAGTREFISSNLCGFNDNLYKRIGRDIRDIGKGLDYMGELLTSPSTGNVRSSVI